MVDQQPKEISGLRLWQWRKAAIQAAIASDVSPAEVDWLLQEVAGLDRLALRLESFKDWPQISLQLPLEELEALWQRRLNDRLPVQYITGVTPWRQFKIAVSPAVLIPRPETECLIDIAVAAVRKGRENLCLEQGHWADLGTGSGAIALGLADAFKEATIHAVDCSEQALLIAQKNAQNLGLADRIRFYQGYWWEPLQSLQGQFSGMVSNPPYIPTSIVSTLQREVVNHEPHLALDGGADGLDCIRHLIATSPAYLRSGGVWLVEMMAGQADAVREMLQNQGSYCNIEIYTDLAGIERFALAYKL
ncbi:MAG: peptide chain release factor N(5)-glutamine methyltransferase [Fischerella sp.]|jgi:release factor glutamine methyltransferase|uniref:peptide chain release factor N(5)-glutamine methyltransferase n=1 Tax=Fischerella sp. TaxID=1191 RepID=UPI0017D3C17F|nr:peptide chain release factor N(5)-glutamine methyltransferase [Fischerella sp.]NWF60668.1 peptide chain release factor N(5)-glutamine methyltransferase [Fischerella sp.]